LVAAVAASALGGAAQAERIYVRAGRLIGTEAGKVVTDRLIAIDDGRVTAVTSYKDPPTDGPK
jgi:imidazolonepropionase-like amidohydrolase